MNQIKRSHRQVKTAAQAATKTRAPGKMAILKNKYEKIIELPLSSKKYRRVFIEVR